MPLSGRICLLVFALVLTFGLLLDRPRSLAVAPATHLPDMPGIEAPLSAQP
ncbi:hypothetical protein [Geminicoccus roseus]|uniref:hypothetical protein n=1 Tax=Geminicoccus roseus TaxID=404900 RepID=UPI0003FCAD48|nr:hypothetical protein [Geminicoccus roseus]